jgi:hypothetical protein
VTSLYNAIQQEIKKKISYVLILSNFYIYIDKTVSGMEEVDYWTTASDAGCPGRFGWCSKKDETKPVPKWLWNENEPGRNKCAVARLPVPDDPEMYAEVALFGQDCNEKAFFICIVIIQFFFSFLK